MNYIYDQGKLGACVAMSVEAWRPVVGYEGLYEISSYGRVKTLTNKNGRRGDIMKFMKYWGPYNVVSLRKDGKYKKKMAHRLVAEAFIPNIDNKRFVNHLDFNHKNNHISNLEWCTREENDKHARDAGHYPHGSSHGNAKLNEHQVRRMKLIKEVDPTIFSTEISKLFGGYNNSSICKILKGNLWTHVL